MELCCDKLEVLVANNSNIVGSAKLFGFNSGQNVQPPVWDLFATPPVGGFFLAAVFNSFTQQIFVACNIAGVPNYAIYDLTGALVLLVPGSIAPLGNYQSNTVAALGNLFFIKRSIGGWFQLDTLLLTESIIASLPTGAIQNTTTAFPKIIQNSVYSVLGGLNQAITTIISTGEKFTETFPLSPTCFVNDGSKIYAPTLTGIYRQTNPGNICSITAGNETGEVVSERYATVPARMLKIKAVFSSKEQLMNEIAYFKKANNAWEKKYIRPSMNYSASQSQNVWEIDCDLMADGDSYFVFNVLPGQNINFKFIGIKLCNPL